MKYQIYLSGAVQKHFGLAAKDLQSDSTVEPVRAWYARWRIEFLISSSDRSQHLFIATNEASYYSFIFPLGDEEGFEDLVSLFYRHWVDALLGRGLNVGRKLLHETQFLRGRPNRLIGAMNQFVSYGTEMALDGKDVNTMHHGVRRLLITKDKDYVRGEEEFERLIATDPPYPASEPGATGPSNVIRFPSPN